MQCAACGFESPPGLRFCGGCGTLLARSCPSCAAECPAEFRYCGSCGSSLDASPSLVTHPTPRALPDPRSYTPKHLREKILAARSALEGERKQVTVLFADIKSSLALAGAMDAEEWHAILDRFFQILADGVHRFEGTVNQYTGDGIMALFGAPLAHEDHAQRACFAVLHLRDGLRSYADELRLARGLDVSVRMGLHSGDVVVGKIGDDLRMDYTAQGAVVGLAARLQQIAGADRACLSETTAKLVRGYFALRDLGEARVKGVEESVRVFELEGRGELRTRFDLSRSRGLSKFVGRAREFAALEAALERALTGSGQVIGVVAEAGTGKSRLCFEFLERCRARGLMVRTTTGVAHGQAVPLLPVFEFYRESFGIEERDDARTARLKIAGNVVRLDEALLPSVPLLDDFLGVADPERPAALPPGPERQRALLGLLKRMTLARSEREPAVLLFEDLHWIDPATETFLENLVDAVDGSRTLLVANFRPEYQAAWTSRSYYQQIALAPLDERAFDEMLAHLLGRDASLAGLTARIHTRTGGSPFFAEELVHELVESGALEGSPGAYRLTTAAPALALPATVQAVLAARIDRLPEREKGVLQTASVVGREFAESLLAQVVDLDPESLAESLRALVRAELLLEAAIYPEAEYAFKHPLTQEVAYGSQLRERRARVHGAVAKAIAAGDAARLDERAALLAHHFEGAGDLALAAHWHQRAARWLEGRDLHTARIHFERVVEILGTAPASVETARDRLQALGRLLHLGIYVGLAPERAAEIYAMGREAVATAREPVLEATLVASYARWLNFTANGDLALAAELGLEALRLADQVGDAMLYSESLIGAVTATLRLGKLAEAMELVDRVAAPRVQTLGADPSLLTRFHGIRAMLVTEFGRLAEAAEEIELAERHLKSMPVEDSSVAIFVESMRRGLLLARGDVAGIEIIARQLAQADERSAHFARVGGRGIFAQLLLRAGRHDEAITACDEAIAIARDTSTALVAVPGLEITRALALLERGDLAVAEQAVAGIDTGVTVFRPGRLRPSAPSWPVPWRLRLLQARLAIARDARGERAAIEALLGEATLEIAATGARAAQSEVHEVRAELARAIGDEAARNNELRQAQRLYAEMGATGHVEHLARLLDD